MRRSLLLFMILLAGGFGLNGIAVASPPPPAHVGETSSEGVQVEASPLAPVIQLHTLRVGGTKKSPRYAWCYFTADPDGIVVQTTVLIKGKSKRPVVGGENRWCIITAKSRLIVTAIDGEGHVTTRRFIFTAS